MILTRSDIRHLAELARLHVSDDEAERLSHDLTEIVGFIDRASTDQESDNARSETSPMIRPSVDVGITRDDKVDDRARNRERAGLSADQAPETEDGYVRVPPVAGLNTPATTDDNHSDPRREPTE